MHKSSSQHAAQEHAELALSAKLSQIWLYSPASDFISIQFVAFRYFKGSMSLIIQLHCQRRHCGPHGARLASVL